MNFLYSCDDKYSPYTGISITSLFENNKELDEIIVYILGLAISEANTKKFDQLAKQYGRKIIIVDAERIDKFLDDNGATSWRGNKVAWYRIFLEKAIPENIERILYLDSDTIVVSSLTEIDAFQLEESKVCAMVSHHRYNEYKNYIGLDEGDACFFSGIILFDMKKWREQKCDGRLKSAISEGYVYFRYPEQDLLCYVLKEAIQKLPPKFNVLSLWQDCGVDNIFAFGDIDEDNFSTRDEIEYAIRNPVILHVMEGHSGVPWQKGNTNPFRKDWDAYREMSPWQGIPQIKKKTTVKEKIRKVMFLVFPRTFYYKISKAYEKWYDKDYYRKYGRLR